MRPQVLFSRLNFWIQTVHGDHTQILWQKSWYSKSFDGTGLVMELYDMLEQRTEGDPIWVNTLSNHCRGPFRWSSIQQGVLVTVCLLFKRIQANNYEVKRTWLCLVICNKNLDKVKSWIYWNLNSFEQVWISNYSENCLILKV